MDMKLKKAKGLTLIELLVALAISGILMAAIYRTFLSQYKTYAVQEQVVDMQQNARVAINRMMREIRMAGFGNVSSVLPNFTAIGGSFNNIINPTDNVNNVGQNDDQVTIIGAFEQISTLASEARPGTNTIQLTGNASEFDKDYRKYICIGGLETHTISSIDTVGNTIILNENVANRFPVDTPVFKVKAITYRLRPDNRDPQKPVLTREDNTDGGGSQVLAENIENLQFRYILRDGTESDLPVSADCPNIRMVRVTVHARTGTYDPEFKGGTGGFRRRIVASNVNVRNMGANP